MKKQLSKVLLGMSFLLGGVHTGEVSAVQITEVGVGFTEIGKVIPSKSWVGTYYIGRVTPNEWCLTPSGFLYLDEEGEPVTNSFVDGKFLDNEGKIVTDKIFEHEGKFYNAKSDGTISQDEWVDGYYFSTSGDLVKSGWVSDEQGNDVLLNRLGRVTKNAWFGEQYLNDTGQISKDVWVDSYYIKSDGYLAKNEWVGSQYFKGNGQVAKNEWVGSQYFKDNGQPAKNEWVTISGTEYLFDNSGNKVTNQKVEKDGKQYYLGNSGEKVKNSSTRVGATVYTSGNTGEITSENKVGKGYSIIGGLVSPIIHTSQYKGYTDANVLMRYTPIPKYYGAERRSPVGQKVYELSVGDTLMIDGVNYRVSERKTGLTYYDWHPFVKFMESSYYDLGLQTCDNVDPYIVICKLIRL